MFERPHHRRIERVLQLLRSAFLRQSSAYFGGGTSIALQIREYRESVDVDFLCNDAEGNATFMRLCSALAIKASACPKRCWPANSSAPAMP
jgi:hypothetical protein